MGFKYFKQCICEILFIHARTNTHKPNVLRLCACGASIVMQQFFNSLLIVGASIWEIFYVHRLFNLCANMVFLVGWSIFRFFFLSFNEESPMDRSDIIHMNFHLFKNCCTTRRDRCLIFIWRVGQRSLEYEVIFLQKGHETTAIQKPPQDKGWGFLITPRTPFALNFIIEFPATHREKKI